MVVLTGNFKTQEEWRIKWNLTKIYEEHINYLKLVQPCQ